MQCNSWYRFELICAWHLSSVSLTLFFSPTPPKGVTLRPDVYGDRGLQIYYNVSDNKTWEGLVTTLQAFLTGKNEASYMILKICAVVSYILGLCA